MGKKHTMSQSEWEAFKAAHKQVGKKINIYDGVTYHGKNKDGKAIIVTEVDDIPRYHTLRVMKNKQDEEYIFVNDRVIYLNCF